MCCSAWGRKESDKTEQLNNNKSHTSIYPNLIIHIQTVYHLSGSSFPLYLHYHVLPFHSLYLLLLLSHFSCVRLFVTSWNAVCQASLSFTISWSLLKLMSVESVMPSNHLVLCHPLLILPSVFPNIRVFSNESALRRRVAKVLELQLQHQSFQ